MGFQNPETLPIYTNGRVNSNFLSFGTGPKKKLISCPQTESPINTGLPVDPVCFPKVLRISFEAPLGPHPAPTLVTSPTEMTLKHLTAVTAMFKHDAKTRVEPFDDAGEIQIVPIDTVIGDEGDDLEVNDSRRHQPHGFGARGKPRRYSGSCTRFCMLTRTLLP